jgi:hypothetical protein
MSSDYTLPPLPEFGFNTAAHYGPRIVGYTREQVERHRIECVAAGRAPLLARIAELEAKVARAHEEIQSLEDELDMMGESGK